MGLLHYSRQNMLHSIKIDLFFTSFLVSFSSLWWFDGVKQKALEGG
jgi:hypothetical protein